jgi:hypothetical protein
MLFSIGCIPIVSMIKNMDTISSGMFLKKYIMKRNGSAQAKNRK